MKNLLSTTLMLIMLFGFTMQFSTADEISKADNSQVSINDLAWMTGRWVGEGFGGTCEEVWNQPLGGSMTGSFKLASKDEITFYEIMTLTVVEGEPKLRIKHFNADLTGWEEKDEVISFEFISLSENHLEFHGLSYQLTHPDSLTITVGTHNAEGESQLMILKCHRE